MEFRAVWWLWALWGLPVLALVLHAGRRHGLRRLVAFAGGLGDRLLENGARQSARTVLGLSGLTFAALALARPAWGVFYEEVRHEGVDVVVLLDVSRSMLAEDAVPNRLGRARIAVHRLVDKLAETGGHRIGLIAFAGTPQVRCPLTIDYAYLRETLDRTDTSAAVRGGTLIGDAIRRAVEMFDPLGEQERVIVLLTDGEDQESFPLEAARAAAAAGVTLYAVGIGDPDGGGRIPYRDAAGKLRFVESGGEPVVSRLDEDTLLQIARATRGGYVPAGTNTILLDEIYEEKVAARQGGVRSVTKERHLHERFQWFVGLSLVLIVLSRLVARRPEDTP
jgi:Ca-activated chloride channel family protein